MQELWDAYDAKFNKIAGKTLIRGNPLPDGVYHLVCDIIVKHADGTYLLMQRDPRKHYGGLWELTAGGSALQGEDPSTCAVRELQEETGLTAANLQELARIVHDGNHAIYVEYLHITNCDKTAVTLQEGETVSFKWVTRDTLLQMSSQELVSQRMLKIVKETGI